MIPIIVVNKVQHIKIIDTWYVNTRNFFRAIHPDDPMCIELDKISEIDGGIQGALNRLKNL